MHVCGMASMCSHACTCVLSWLEPIWPLPSFPQPCFLPAERGCAARGPLNADRATSITAERNSFPGVKHGEGACPCSQTLFPERWQRAALSHWHQG